MALDNLALATEVPNLRNIGYLGPHLLGHRSVLRKPRWRLSELFFSQGFEPRRGGMVPLSYSTSQAANPLPEITTHGVKYMLKHVLQ